MLRPATPPPRLPRRVLLWLGALCCLAASPAQAQNPGDEPGLAPPPGPEVRGKMPENIVEIDVAAAAGKPNPLRLERDDVIKLAVLGYPELSHIARIQRDGRVTLPMVGGIEADGKTLDELRESVRLRLAATAQQKSPTVQVDDVLRLMVWRHPDLTFSAPVAIDGTISLPLAGEIQAEGKTIPEIREAVRLKLEPYLRDPQVSILYEKQVRRGVIVDPQVSILPERTRERTVVVLGEVTLPGQHLIGEQSRVLDALSGARLNMQNAQLNEVVIIRNADGKVPEYTKLRLADFLDGTAPNDNIYLAPNDIIFVPKTVIASIGDFIDRFFTRTKPMFDWWNALYQAKYADQYYKNVIDQGKYAIAIYNRTLNP